MSVLTYSMPVWSGTAGYLLAALQTVQAEAARVVTGRNWDLTGPGPRRVSTADLLKQCGWLSVEQLGAFTSLIELKKVLIHKEPKYLYDKLMPRPEHQGAHGTRQNFHHTDTGLESNGKLEIATCRLEIARDSWRWRAPTIYNTLPTDYRSETSLAIFKSKVKVWAREHF